MNIYDYFACSVRRFPDKDALVYGHKRYTYSELDARVRKLASVLGEWGVGPGSTVGILCHNSNAYLEAILAVGLVGAKSEHFNWRVHPDALVRLLEDSECSVLFVSGCGQGAMDAISQIDRELKVVCADEGACDIDIAGGGAMLSYEDLVSGQDVGYDKYGMPVGYVNLPPDAPLFIYYTSGTTSAPKGVQFSINSIIQHTLASITEMKWTHEDVYLCVLPLYHTSSSGAYCMLFKGGTIILQDHFDVREYIDTIETEHVTKLGLVPNMVDWLCQADDIAARDLSSVKALAYAGAPMSMKELIRANEVLKCGFIQLYGMTEMAPQVALLKPEDHAMFMRAGADRLPCGRAMLGVNLRIVDDAGTVCGVDEVGEIIVNGVTMMQEYVHQPKKTSRAIRDGWYYTGDMGSLDKDGYLYLSGRKSQMIISGGENIYPKEVEECIRAMGPEILDVGVVGLPDDKWGETVCAFVVKSSVSAICADDVIACCKQHMDSYKKPRHVVF
ncbi:MAG: AMP-binding protein, partial [Coriobacteriales bacterium]|nr:AMP-binding protein [Coriobacteriales bacterium]